MKKLNGGGHVSLNIVHTEHDHWKAIHLGIFS
jgi:hypothetical protein